MLMIGIILNLLYTCVILCIFSKLLGIKMLDFLAVILRPNVQLYFVEFGAKLGCASPIFFGFGTNIYSLNL